MNRFSTPVLVVFMILGVAFVVATPTTPVVVDTSSLPTWYVFQDGLGVNITKSFVPMRPYATAKFNASASSIGWDFLQVNFTNANFEADKSSYYYGGWAEGYLTQKQILQIATNLPIGTQSPEVMKWIENHINFVQSEVKNNMKFDEYWMQVGNLLDQLQGMTDGYNAAAIQIGAANMTFMDFFLFNFQAELGDIQAAVQVQAGKKLPKSMLRLPYDSHCSAIVKVTHDDLFMSHDTWDGFSGMAYRMFKVYKYQRFSFGKEQSDITISFSAHPAFISSVDDWYQTSELLAIQETTNGIMNETLYNAVVPNCVSEFMRVMVANILAKNGEDWTTYFSRYNSGTYNNQYMVVDFKVFVPGASIAPGTLWIAEQIPGFMYRADVSDHLKNEGYWASYNIPYSDYIYKVSGYEQYYQEQGNFWSYTKYARPEIFRRNQSDIVDLAGVQKLMRYNNYQFDPLSLIQNCTAATNGVCDPPHSSMLAIASRGDLMTTYPTEAEMIAHYGVVADLVAQGCFGAIDTKIANYKNRYSMVGTIISGPTSDQQPVFKWGVGVCPAAPKGSPTVVDFPWVQFKFDYL